jgi:hypothetical protein
MGFDTSHHPVDLKMVARVTDYIAGKGSIDDLVKDAVRVAKIRFRANAWGLGVTNLKKAPDAFDTSLHVWGRPFFVAASGTEAIGEMIDRYLAAKTSAQADAIAKENLALLDKALPKRVKPTKDGSLPNDAKLAESIRRNIELLRSAHTAAKTKGGTVKLPNGEDSDAAHLLEREVPLQVLTFCAASRPGWMDRGYVWPTTLFARVKIKTGKLFTPPRAMLGKLGDEKRKWFLERAITENYMVGGFVSAKDVPAFCKLLEKSRAKLEGAFGDPDQEVATSVRKLVEAAEDAKMRKLAFAEATEVYSGFAGIMN